MSDEKTTSGESPKPEATKKTSTAPKKAPAKKEAPAPAAPPKKATKTDNQKSWRQRRLGKESARNSKFRRKAPGKPTVVGDVEKRISTYLRDHPLGVEGRQVGYGAVVGVKELWPAINKLKEKGVITQAGKRLTLTRDGAMALGALDAA